MTFSNGITEEQASAALPIILHRPLSVYSTSFAQPLVLPLQGLRPSRELTTKLTRTLPDQRETTLARQRLLRL